MALINRNRRPHDQQRRLLNARQAPPAIERHPEASRDQGLPGIITFLNIQSQWGFIKADGNSYFFHRTCLEDGAAFDRLTVGDHVVFEPTRAKKGLRAENVRPL